MQEKGMNLKEMDCMSLEGFCICVSHDIQKKLGNRFKVEVRDIAKNNDTRLKGLIIMEQDNNTHPTVYMDSFYGRYQEGESLEEIERKILLVHKESRTENQFDASFFTDWQEVEKKVIYKLVNLERNRELLKDVPYKKILDLAVVYECFLEVSEAGSGTILIHNSHLKLWRITEEELHATALRNTPGLMGYMVSSLTDIMLGITGSGEAWIEEPSGMAGLEKDQFSMHVLTNRHKLHGAGCILYKNLLQEIAEKWGCDICIIPSSIHEVILMPMEKAGDYGDISQMVREINQMQVAPEEVLSDHVYHFIRETGEITMQEEEEYE